MSKPKRNWFKPNHVAFCRSWAQDMPIAGTTNPKQDLHARGSTSTANFQHSSLMNNHHVCVITDPRKGAILHFSLKCQELPTPLGISEWGLNGPAFSTSNIYSGRKEATPFFPLELGQIWASKSHTEAPQEARKKTKQKQETYMDLMGKLQLRSQCICWSYESTTNAFPERIFLFVWRSEGPRNMQMCKLLGKVVMFITTLHLILQKSKLTFKNEVYTGRRD